MAFTAQKYVRQVVTTLERTYPDRGTALEFKDPWQLLTATILSAQCTDVMVNKVTPRLFASYPSMCALGHADILAVEAIIKSTGFFHNKAKAIIAESLELCEKWGGTVTPEMDFLTRRPWRRTQDRQRCPCACIRQAGCGCRHACEASGLSHRTEREPRSGKSRTGYHGCRCRESLELAL